MNNLLTGQTLCEHEQLIASLNYSNFFAFCLDI